MKNNYQNIISEFEKIKTNLTNPDIINDHKKLKIISQKFNQLEIVVKKIKRIEKLEKLIIGSKNSLIEETDPDLIAIAEQELDDYEKEKSIIESKIKEGMKASDPMNKKNVIVEIRAGTGGDESALFTADLFRMYSRFAEDEGWKIKIISSNRSNVGGFKEIIFEIIGNKAYGKLKYESGVHRVQRVPKTEKSGRVHTSAATVAVLPKADEMDMKINPSDLKIDVFRSGGHGGQSVNTTDSAVRITHIPSGLVIGCQDERSQQQNKIKAMQVLRSRLLAMKNEQKQKERQNSRKKQVGTGDRSEKIRTYNFPQNRVTDHRVKKNWHNINEIMDGKLTKIISSLKLLEDNENKSSS